MSSGVGVAGLLGMALWLVVARRYGMDGPYAALVNLLALHRARSWRAVEDGGPVAARVRWAAGIAALCWLGVLVAGRMIGCL